MKIKNVLLVWLLALVALGCGGGGDTSFNGSGSSGGGGNASVPVFATDAPGNNFQHVWVTIYSIDLVNSTGSTVNVFSSSTGLTLDVRSLHDSAGQLLQFISAANVPAGTYTSVKLTLGNSVTVVKNGQVNSTTYQFANANTAGSGKALFTVALNPPYTANGSNPLVLDFVVSQWSIDAQGNVHATITLGNPHGSKRQHSSQLEGTISALSGTTGNQTFTLQLDHNRTVQVSTTTNTTIFNANGSPNPSLSNGERVHVTGTYSNGVFTATTIKIQKGQSSSGSVDVIGTFSNIDSTNDTFTLTVQDTDDFAPGTIVVNVATNTNTQYLVNGVSESASDFFYGLTQAASGAQVEVQGTISGNTLTASYIRLLPTGSNQPNAEVSGLTSNVNATGGTFTITASDWDGISLQNGAQVNVVTTSNTYFNLNGNQVTQAQWFAALTSATQVKVFGTYTNGTLTASAAVIGNDNDGQGHKHHGHQP